MTEEQALQAAEQAQGNLHSSLLLLGVILILLAIAFLPRLRWGWPKKNPGGDSARIEYTEVDHDPSLEPKKTDAVSHTVHVEHHHEEDHKDTVHGGVAKKQFWQRAGFWYFVIPTVLVAILLLWLNSIGAFTGMDSTTFSEWTKWWTEVFKDISWMTLLILGLFVLAIALIASGKKGGILVLLVALLLLGVNWIGLENLRQLSTQFRTTVVGSNTENTKSHWEPLVDGKTYTATENEWIVFSKPIDKCPAVDSEGLEVKDFPTEYWVRSWKGTREFTMYILDIGDEFLGTACCQQVK